MAQPTQKYILKWSRMISPQVKHLAFEREDAHPLPFVAGQFITLHIPAPDQGKILHRSYSIANKPGENNEIEIACSYVEGGVASTLLFNLKPGEPIEASGPYGLFVLKEEQPKRYILIATGTGITPYRSMLTVIENRLKQEPALSVVLIQGVRKQEDLLFGEEFSKFASQIPNFEFKACYSRAKLDAADGTADAAVERILKPHERHGHIQDVFPELSLNPAEDIIYLCGNPNMIDEAFAYLTSLGFDRKSVRREKYLFSH